MTGYRARTKEAVQRLQNAKYRRLSANAYPCVDGSPVTVPKLKFVGCG